MKEIEKRNLVLKIAWNYQGRFYKWGGDDPSGFDCSGLFIECGKSVPDCLPRKGDWRARDLFNMFVQVSRGQIQPGDLVFWNDGHGTVIHVEIVINNYCSIGASGGGSKTITNEDAIRHNAFIKVRPFDSRYNLHGFVNPYVRK
jgi:cell wall-associated NlpC family hydrolase